MAIFSARCVAGIVVDRSKDDAEQLPNEVLEWLMRCRKEDDPIGLAQYHWVPIFPEPRPVEARIIWMGAVDEFITLPRPLPQEYV
jgi:hypothetical protein